MSLPGEETTSGMAMHDVGVLPPAGWHLAYFAHSPLSIMVADATGRFVEVNPAACRISGYDEAELLGMSLVDLLAEESLETGRKHFETVRQTGRASSELCWVRKDGVKRWSICHAVRLSDDRFVGFLTETTDRKRAERILQARLRLLELSADCSLEELLVATVDEAENLTGSQIGFFHFLEADQQTISLQAWSTRTSREFCKAEGKGRHYDLAKAGVWVDCVQARRPVIHNAYAELPNRRGLPPGHASIVRELIVPVLRDEQIVAILGVGNKPGYYDESDIDSVARLADLSWDIAGRKRAEQEKLEMERRLFHAQKLESLGVLAGGIAHDFNNLLAGIMGYAELAMLSLPPGEAAQGNIDAIKTSVRKAADLTQQMLAYSGKGKFLVEAVHLSQVVEGLKKMLAVSVSKKTALTYDLAADLPTIRADASQMGQVVMNLVINASESLGERGGQVVVSTSAAHFESADRARMILGQETPEGPCVRLRVADTGCGMDAEMLHKVFEPFFSTKFTGRGLGLAAVHGIVRGHKGAIHVASAPGHGATFDIYFPAVTASAAAADELPPAPIYPGHGVILIVEDEETIRVLTQRIIEKAGYSVLAAKDGEEAIRLFGQHRDEIACVLLDLTMPDLSGEETFQELRKIRPDVRVILSSGYGEEWATDHFIGRGLAGFLQKPYRFERLLAKLREVLSTP